MNDLKLQKAHEDKVAQENLDAAKAFAEELKDKQVTVGIKVGEGGRTFGSISAKEIAEAAKAQLGYELDKKETAAFSSDQRAGYNYGANQVTPEGNR